MRQKLSKTSDKPHKYIIFHTIHKCEEVGYLLIEDYFFFPGIKRFYEELGDYFSDSLKFKYDEELN